MHFDPVAIFFQIVVLLFAISVHESAHAWMANRLGDPTAKMLGRVSLNPIVHIDPFGTILVPALLVLFGFPAFGWAKPTPVDSRNFKHIVRDDILTAVAGPVSNFITAFFAVVILSFIVHGSVMPSGGVYRGLQLADPLTAMFWWAMEINVVLAVFNLIPLPPLDGSHVVRHFLSYESLKMYDRFGYFGLMMLMFVLPMLNLNIIGVLISPFLGFYQQLLNLFLRL
ncbi:MAG: site-2 protease family protein [Candidatus Korobacteraceae bacterium]